MSLELKQLLTAKEVAPGIPFDDFLLKRSQCCNGSSAVCDFLLENGAKKILLDRCKICGLFVVD
ncbi:hypothetical protein D918_02297 [Trichuris suis]|nr:hypothetical protein D918_02297 [Trichuris suis]